MTTVKMLRDEVVSLPAGPLWLKREAELELDDKIAASLVGRGYAVMVVKNGHKETLQRSELESMTLVQIREIAEKQGVQDFRTLRKSLLIDSLCPVTEET